MLLPTMLTAVNKAQRSPSHVNFVNDKRVVGGEESHTFYCQVNTARVDSHLVWRCNVDSGKDRVHLGADKIDHIVVVALDDDVV